MKTFRGQFRLWRHYKITTASLVIVLLMISTYRQADPDILMKTYGLVTKEHHHTEIDQEMKTVGDVTLVNIRQQATGVVENIVGKSIFVMASLTRKTKLPPLDKYWARILHFVPEENSQDCLNLFTTESSQSIAITPEWEKVKAAAQMPENRVYFAPQHEKLTLTYQELARLEFVHTVCEIGFNIGQSAITWLTAKPDLKLYSFDIGGELPEKMGRALEKLFPDRFKLFIGDSTKTVPLWIEQGMRCDIVFIDGGHTYPIVRADILNMQKAVSKQHVIVLDDIYYPGVNRAWMEMVEKDVVHHLFDCWIKGQDIDFAIGHYKNFAGNSVYIDTRLTRKTKLPRLDEYWARILHFVPKENSQDCLNLFTTESSRFAAITPEWEEIRGLAVMSEFRHLFAPRHMKLTLTYQELAQLQFVHTVCEIGFNIGQSAITWLTAKPDLKLYSFDIGGEMPQKMGRVLENLFPDRFQLIIGDLTKTVPLWIDQGMKCDIVFIDGGHTYPIVRANILNMQMAAAKQHIIVLDDIYHPDVNRAWKEMVKNSVIHHLFDCWIKGQDIDFALGRYKKIYVE